MSRHARLESAIEGRPPIAPAPPTLKPRVAGLVTVTNTFGTPPDTVVDASHLVHGINHTMLRLKWSDLEPTEGSYAFASFLDPLINSAPAGTGIKMGVDTGRFAPDWLKAQTGTVDVYNSKDGFTSNVPLWWTDTAHNAYAALMAAMAARYDSDPRILQIVATGSMQAYFEPWILGGDAASGARIYAAGCDQATQVASVERSLRETLAAWSGGTRVEFALHNQWQTPKPTGITFQPWSFGRDWLNPIAAEFGNKLVLTDYGVGQSDTRPDTTGQTLLTATSEYGWMYLRSQSGQGPVGYQLTLAGYTGTFAQAEQDALDNCLSLGASYAETNAWGGIPAAAQTSYDTALKAQAG